MKDVAKKLEDARQNAKELDVERVVYQDEEIVNRLDAAQGYALRMTLVGCTAALCAALENVALAFRGRR